MNEIKTIDDVLVALDEIIARSIAENDPLGYFAVLYRRVTAEVKQGISDQLFDDGARMEKLDVVFALRYLEAYQAHRSGGEPTLSWQKAFAMATSSRPIVMQHLLMGINAHINLDLGIAAAEVANSGDINLLEGDFNKINRVLSSLVNEVQQNLVRIWPALRWVLSKSGNIDDVMVDFSMKLARDGAWKFATKIAGAPKGEYAPLIAERDGKVARKSRIISHPGFMASLLIMIIRLTERGTVASKILALQGVEGGEKQSLNR